MPKYIGTKADLQALAALVNKAETRPQKGEPYGGGIHVVIPDTYSPGAVGWLLPVEVVGNEIQLAAEKLETVVVDTKLDGNEKAQAVTLVGKLSLVTDAVT